MKVLALVVLLAACGKGSDQKEEPKTVEPTGSGSAEAKTEPVSDKAVPGFEAFKVTNAGKAVGMQRAFVKRVSPDQWRVFVSDLEGSCAELLSGVTDTKKGATSLSVTMEVHLAPDGGETVAVTDVWTTGHPTQATYTTAKISGPTDKDARVTIELAKITDTDNGRVITAEGTFVAIGCGDQPPMPAGIPKDKHVSAASITVAGRKVELMNAVVEENDGLTVSTGPKDCDSFTPGAQLSLRKQYGKWLLYGTWIDKDQELAESAAKDLKVTFGAQGSGKDGPTIAVTIAGSAKIGAYEVTLDGTIEAIDCPKPKK